MSYYRPSAAAGASVSSVTFMCTFASSAGGAVVANLKRKERDATAMAESLSAGNQRRRDGRSHRPDPRDEHVQRRPARDRACIPGRSRMNCMDQVVTDQYAAYHGDCVEVLKGLPDASVGYWTFSPPFASLYT